MKIYLYLLSFVLKSPCYRSLTDLKFTNKLNHIAITVSLLAEVSPRRERRLLAGKITVSAFSALYSDSNISLKHANSGVSTVKHVPAALAAIIKGLKLGQVLLKRKINKYTLCANSIFYQIRCITGPTWN